MIKSGKTMAKMNSAQKLRGLTVTSQIFGCVIKAGNQE